MSPPDLTPAEIERLALLAEECGEVVQAVAKVLRHGYESRWPPGTGPTNREDLEREVGNLMAAVALMYDCDLDEAAVGEHEDAKLAELPRWLHHQVRL